LGGALAVLAAVDMKANLNLEPSLYTFGQPRVGNTNFAAFQNSILKGDNFRGVYRNDPVPTIPFESVLNFYHAGTEVHFYECATKDYVAYPFNKDDHQITDLLAVQDHEGYFCLLSGQMQTSVTNHSSTKAFLQ